MKVLNQVEFNPANQILDGSPRFSHVKQSQKLYLIEFNNSIRYKFNSIERLKFK